MFLLTDKLSLTCHVLYENKELLTTVKSPHSGHLRIMNIFLENG